jgi:hypothetical protein
MAVCLCLVLTAGLPVFAGQIHDAASSGDTLKVVVQLLDHPEWVNARDSDGYTPLHCAASRGHREVVEVLLRKGASINATNRSGSTLLLLARGFGHTSVAVLLRQHGGIVIERPVQPSWPVYAAAPPKVNRPATAPVRRANSSSQSSWPRNTSGGDQWGLVGKTCDGCGGSVSMSAQVGDRCPHCGGVWGGVRYVYR